MKRLFLFLALLIASVTGAHAQGTWSAVQTINVPSMPNGHMFYQYLLLNYTGTGTKSPMLVYEHVANAGNGCYPSTPTAAACTGITGNSGSGVNTYFNNSTFQGLYCANGCIIVSPAADQTGGQNWGGNGDSPGTAGNEIGVIAVIQQLLATTNADPTRIYVTGDDIGGTGAQAIALDFGQKTGTQGRIVTATLAMSGSISRNGQTTPTSAQLAQIEGGGLQFNVGGGTDTTPGNNPTLWIEPVWNAIAGSLTPPGPAAAAGFNTLTFGPSISVGTTANPSTSYPEFTTNNWAPYAFSGSSWTNIGFTANADGSVTMNGVGQAFGNGLATASPGPSGGPRSTFGGQTFGGGAFFQARMKFNGPSAFWANDIETQNGVNQGIGPNPWVPAQPNAGSSIYGDWMELDMAEFDTTGIYGGAMHNWYAGNICSGSSFGTNSLSPPGTVACGINSLNSGSSFNQAPTNCCAGADFTQYHNYGYLWIPATGTTQGVGAWYFDGAQVGNTYTWNKYSNTLAPPPVDTGHGGSSAYSVLDTLHMYLILGGSSGTTTTISGVQVWQANGQNDLPVITASSSAYPGPPNGAEAASSPYYLLIDTSLGHSVWATYRAYPAAEVMLNLLFAQVSSSAATCAPDCSGLTGTPSSPLPSGYLGTSGNQITGAAGNVKLACTGYDIPTASVTNDISAMRVQGFNCARVPWFDKVMCPGGTCSFTNFDAIVAAASTYNMKVIFDHASNEGVAGSASCTNQQGNGLWYDLNGVAPWNGTNNTDGCGTAGTVTYAQFKANSVALATHYSGNTTVVGFDLHNEPTTYGNPACCSSGGGGNGLFSEKNGTITDPSGNTFVPHGVDLGMNFAVDINTAITSASGAPLITLFPNINYVRVAVFDTGNGGLSNATYPAPSSFSQFITWATANHIVVELEDHSSNGGCWEDSISGSGCGRPSNPPTGAALTTYTNYWSSVATMYANNPYVWIGSYNEIDSGDGSYSTAAIAAIYTYENALYNAVRAVSPNVIIDMGMGVGGGNPGTNGSAAVSGTGAAALVGAWTNTIWYMHSYYTDGTPSGALAQVQGSTAACCGGNGGSGYLSAQTMNNASGVVPVIINEFGSQTGNQTNGDASSIISALTTVQGNGIGSSAWEWFSQGSNLYFDLVNNGNTTDPVCSPIITISSSCMGLTTWGGQVSTMISGFPPPSPANTVVGADWGKGDGGDALAMANDVGGAIETADPGALVIVEGPYNNGTLFNGTARGSSALPITAGAIADLTLAGSKPVTCCAGKTVYSIHDMPNSVTGVAPDAGNAAVTMRNTAWGYLVSGNTAPVWIGKMGADLDNTNGSVADETAWVTGLTQYMNGMLGALGAPIFTGCQQPIGGDWWDFGNNSANSPNGTLLASGANKPGQQNYWSTILYTTCSTQSVTAVTWNPNDASAGITLSNSALTSTLSAAGNNSVRSTTSYSTGNVCADIQASSISPNWTVGIANAAFVLTQSGGVGINTSAIGIDPNSGGGLQGIFYNNVRASNGATASVNGDVITECFNFGTSMAWFSDTAMRGSAFSTAFTTQFGNGAGSSTNWNNSTTADPATGVGGISFSGLTCPCFLIFSANESGAQAILNATGPLTVATPAGFTTWQPGTVVTQPGRPFILIMGQTDPLPWLTMH